MSVKDGLPATDLNRMNREYVKNLAEGESVPDGLPATDLSRMNRDWIKAVVEEAGGGGDITVEAATFTENGTFTAPEGKAYSPVNVNVPSRGALIASGTFTGNGGYQIDVPIGESAPIKNFLFTAKIRQSVIENDSKYKIVQFHYIYDGPSGFAPEQLYPDRYFPGSGTDYAVDDTALTYLGFLRNAMYIRTNSITSYNGSVAEADPTELRINTNPDSISFHINTGNFNYIFINGEIYDWDMYYIGDDYANESMTVGG